MFKFSLALWLVCFFSLAALARGPLVLPQWAEVSDRALPTAITGGMWLVAAEVSSVKPTQQYPDIYAYRYTITHAYSGPPELVGRNFVLVGSKPGLPKPGAAPPAASQAPLIASLMSRPEKKGIFVVSWSKDTMPGFFGEQPEDIAVGPNGAYGDFVSTGPDDKDFAQNKAFAEAVEKVYRAKPDEQVNLLRSYAAGSTWSLVTWAFRELTATHGYEPFMKKLLDDPHTTLNKQILIDGFLSGSEDRTWINSPERQKLLTGWLQTKTSQEDHWAVVSSLAYEVERNKIEGHTLFALLGAALNSKAELSDETSNAGSLILRLLGGRNQAWQDKMFDFLVQQIKAAPETAAKSAAHLLYFAPWLTPEQRTILLDLKQQAKSQEVAGLLQQALDNPDIQSKQ